MIIIHLTNPTPLPNAPTKLCELILSNIPINEHPSLPSHNIFMVGLYGTDSINPTAYMRQEILTL